VVEIESLDYEGRGVAHADGKAVFIEGALPGEEVEYSPYRKKDTYEFAQVTRIQRASFTRVTPRCAHFGVCGGCILQHADWLAQVAAKQRVLEDNLQRIGKVTPGQLLPPIYGLPWGYRQRARLSVRHVRKKGRVLVGFREKRGSFVADMLGCETLDARAARLIEPLGAMILKLSMPEAIPQIEVAVGERVTALTLRVLQEPSADDQFVLCEFAQRHGVQFWLQRGGPATVVPFYPLDAPALDYALPEFGLRLTFGPTEFTQVNFAVNRLMVRRALDLLDARPGESVVDLFCGLGNFSLAIAARGAHVLGLEGEPSAIRRAQQNAQANALEHRARFRVMDLYKAESDALAPLLNCDKLLIDPPRDGAFAVAKALAHDTTAPRRIVYVSCNPATLARDADIIVHEKGYALRAAGIINMFPHTAHVESVACFERAA
jgi:23S rRNA (uracil1939-C5)-methyltransferase